MNFDILNEYLCQLKDNFVCNIDEKKSDVESNVYIVRANNIENNESAKKFIHLFTTVTNTSYIFNFELQNPTK